MIEKVMNFIEKSSKIVKVYYCDDTHRKIENI